MSDRVPARAELRVRLADEDRDRAVHRVQQAFADGRLSPGEMEERLERALTATSRGDLEPALAGLPDPLDDVVRLGTTGGHVKRSGDWRVPRLLWIESEYGKVRLDLSRAALDHPLIDIELRLAYGSATIILPPGATADADGARSHWGSVTCKAPGRPRPGSAHVRVGGEVDHGSVLIRYPRTWHRAGR
ncbi:DUF1707 SHOCT-like domain-containing protein [Nonomuraea sp. NPDC002799]